MDKTFKEQKESGNITTEFNPETGELILTKKRFDPETGEETEPVIQVFNSSNLIARKAQLQKELADINDMIKEVPSGS